MKKILVSIIITFGLIQAEEWIYYNGSEGVVSRVKPDGTENEVIVDGVLMMDMSLDKSKIVSLGEQTITIVDIETMNTQSVFFPEYGLSPKDIHFAYDENTIIFTDWNELYKYSFIDSSFTLIVPDMGGNIDIQNITMSPDKQKAVFLSYDIYFDEGDSIDVMIADIQSGEVSILESIPSLWNDCYFGLLPGFQTYWGADDYIYFTICDGVGVQQLLKIHSSNGEPAQQVENEILYTLSAADDSFLEKLVYLKYINDSLEYWMIELESNESSYIDIYGQIEGNGIFWFSQAWSPNNSKVAITGWYNQPGTWGNVSGLNVYDTVTDSMITIVDYVGAWAPMFWVSGSDNGDVNGDGSLDILDIVMIVNMILTNETNSTADYNSDGEVNILDIVAIVQVILN